MDCLFDKCVSNLVWMWSKVGTAELKENTPTMDRFICHDFLCLNSRVKARQPYVAHIALQCDHHKLGGNNAQAAKKFPLLPLGNKLLLLCYPPSSLHTVFPLLTQTKRTRTGCLFSCLMFELAALRSSSQRDH